MWEPPDHLANGEVAITAQDGGRYARLLLVLLKWVIPAWLRWVSPCRLGEPMSPAARALWPRVPCPKIEFALAQGPVLNVLPMPAS